ncbi:hypothetical protein HB162lentus_02290 [Mammaliicoccus lentus]
MKNIEKLERILMKELVEKNVEIVRNVQKLEISHARVSGMYGGYTFSDYKYDIEYLLTLNEEGYQPFRNIDVELSIDLSDLKGSKDSDDEIELLVLYILNHIEQLEDKIKQQIKQLDYQNSYVREVKEKVQKYFDGKRGMKKLYFNENSNISISPKGINYVNTPLKSEILVTPDGIDFGSEAIIKPIPSEKILLGNLTLQEKDGKLTVTDKSGSTRFI